jgi:hypothetical protein
VSGLDSWLLGFRSAVIVCDLDSNLASILSPAGKVLPNVLLSTAGYDDVLQVDPCLANEIRLLVVGENRNLKLVVIRGVVNGEAKLLIPTQRQHIGSESSSLIDLPFGCLSASNIC